MAYFNRRKSKTGAGIIVSIITMSAFLYVWPYFAHLWWREMSSLIREYDMTINEFYLSWSLFQAFCMSVLVQGFFGICYVGQFAFIERYKVVDEPWPW